MGSKKGIGLIEFIISINIILIVVVGAYYAFNLGIKTYKRIENQNYSNQNFRKAVSLISRDIRCTFYKEKDNFFQGERESLEFFTYLPSIYSASGGLARIKYYINEGLIREQNEKKQTIAPLITSINFRYYDGMNWYDFWNLKDKKKLPVAIQITLKVGNENFKECEEFKNIVKIYSDGV